VSRHAATPDDAPGVVPVVAPLVDSVDATETAADAAQVDIRVVAGSPTALDLAALSAVLTGVLEEMGDDLERDHASAPSAWDRSTRAVRSAPEVGHGRWRSFTGN